MVTQVCAYSWATAHYRESAGGLVRAIFAENTPSTESFSMLLRLSPIVAR